MVEQEGGLGGAVRWCRRSVRREQLVLVCCHLGICMNKSAAQMESPRKAESQSPRKAVGIPPDSPRKPSAPGTPVSAPGTPAAVMSDTPLKYGPHAGVAVWVVVVFFILPPFLLSLSLSLSLNL